MTRQPLFKMSDADISPRLVTMFRDTRKRLLPSTARDLYAKAKADFEQQQYATSSAEFKDLLALLGDEDLTTDSTSTVADLKMLAEGFAKLAETNAASAAKGADLAPASVAQPIPLPPAPQDPTPRSEREGLHRDRHERRAAGRHLGAISDMASAELQVQSGLPRAASHRDRRDGTRRVGRDGRVGARRA